MDASLNASAMPNPIWESETQDNKKSEGTRFSLRTTSVVEKFVSRFSQISLFINSGSLFTLRCSLILLFTLYFSRLTIAQQANIDSLYSVWQNSAETDSTRIFAYKTYIWDGYLFIYPDSAIALADAMHQYAKSHNYPQAENQANALKGLAHGIIGDFSISMDFLLKSLEGSKEINDKWNMTEVFIGIGVLYDDQGNFPIALDYYYQALAIAEETGNQGGMAMALNNIAGTLSMQEEYALALEYYHKALAIDEKLGVKQGVATELANIGTNHKRLGEYDQALDNFRKALAISEEIQDLDGIAFILSYIGEIFDERGAQKEAMQYYEEALAIYEKLGKKTGIAMIKRSIGFFYLNQNMPQRAIASCEECLVIAKNIGANNTERAAHKCLAKAYKSIGKHAKAYDHLEQMLKLNDVIFNEENTKKLTRLQMQYEFQKKEAAALAEQQKKDAEAAQRLKQQKIVRNSFMGGFAVVLIFAAVFFNQRNRISREKQRSEELLLNILPEETAQELKEKGSAEAKLINQVTVLFTDFKGFTAMSEKLSPKELVKDLHECFSEFDRICEKYGIEKIKTIGDAYMAAGGLPTPNNTHATDVIKAGLEMAVFVVNGKARKIANNLPFFEIRIGVHTGPVVAGIVGIKKFSYDIWGDTVNTASRMESSGEVGKVNISESTYKLVKDDFNCEFRGKIAAKGKGEIEMYFVGNKSMKS